MKSNIRIKFTDGSNPPTRTGVAETGPSQWAVEPWQEYPEGTRMGLYHFRLDLCLVNEGRTSRREEFVIKWPHATGIVAQYLDFAYLLMGNGRLRRFEGMVEQSSVRITVVVPPGVSWLSTNPAWHLAHNDAWFRGMRSRGHRTGSLGVGKNKKPIRFVELGSGPKIAVVIARLHPYESASSYSATGVAEWLGKKGSAQSAILREWKVFVVPVANPDGVAEGCTRLTGRDGADLNIDALAQGDPVALALKSWLDLLKPDLFLDFHNWMSKTVNGLYYFEKPDLWAFLQAFDSMIWDGRTWYADQIGADLKSGDPERQILERYCRKNFGTLSYVLEFPWHGSTPASQKESGARGFQAAIKAHRQRGMSSS